MEEEDSCSQSSFEDEESVIEEAVSLEGEENNDLSDDLIPFMDGVWYRSHSSEEEEGVVNSVLLVVEEAKMVYFSGKMEVEVVQGSVEILGYRMTIGEERRKVFSLKGHSSLLYIQGVTSDERKEGFEDLPEGFAGLLLRPFEDKWTTTFRNMAVNGETLLGPEVVTVRLREPYNEEQEGTGEEDEDVEENEPIGDSDQEGDKQGPVMKPIKKLPNMKHWIQVFGFQLMPEGMMKNNKGFIVNPIWEELLDQMKNDKNQAGDFALPERLCAFGGKNVGKSTFCKWLMNKMISSTGGKPILYVDLDPGQTEFNPPGIIALHLISEPILGPNFTHLKHPERAVFLGGVNVADYALAYVEAVGDLIRFAGQHYGDMDWIINTMGFTSGIGIPLAMAVVKVVRPTAVVQLQITSDHKGSFPHPLDSRYIAEFKPPAFLLPLLDAEESPVGEWCAHFEYKISLIESIFSPLMNGARTTTTPRSNNARSLRETVMVSYFAHQSESQYYESLTSTVSLALSCRPYCFSLHHCTIGVMHAAMLDWTGILKTLIGSLVALCNISDNPLKRAYQHQHSQNPMSSSRPVVDDEPVPGPSSKTSLSYISSDYSFPNKFVGYGICRSYDKDNLELHIITPLSEEQLREVNAIICAAPVGLPAQLIVGKRRAPYQVHPPYIAARGKGAKITATGKKHHVHGKRAAYLAIKNNLL